MIVSDQPTILLSAKLTCIKVHKKYMSYQVPFSCNHETVQERFLYKSLEPKRFCTHYYRCIPYSSVIPTGVVMNSCSIDHYSFQLQGDKDFSQDTKNFLPSVL